jgi:hypothetical protein
VECHQFSVIKQLKYADRIIPIHAENVIAEVGIPLESSANWESSPEMS